MSKKPAELSTSLVAIKGQAAPAPDMPGRVAPKVDEQERRAKPDSRAGEGAPKSSEELTPLNFRIPASFRREFKTYAATHDMKLNELLRHCFEAYRKAHDN